jgi:hypothetical protein
MAIDIAYPYATSPRLQVPGNGFFCAWGTVSGVGILKAECDDGINPIAGVPITNPLSPCDWAYSFSSVPTGNTTLKVYPDDGGNPTEVDIEIAARLTRQSKA